MSKNSNHDSTPESPQLSWFERPGNIRLMIGLLIFACLAVLAAEWWWGPFFDEHHPAHFEVENVFGFQAVFGFVAFVVIVFLGKWLRPLLKREGDYYDS